MDRGGLGMRIKVVDAKEERGYAKGGWAVLLAQEIRFEAFFRGLK